MTALNRDLLMPSELCTREGSKSTSSHGPDCESVAAGDWPCPSCGANNFARRTECFRCAEPRCARLCPADAQQIILASALGSGASALCIAASLASFAARACLSLRLVFVQLLFCAYCAMHVVHAQGVLLNLPAPVVDALLTVPRPANMPGAEGMGRQMGTPEARDGDWVCPECGVNNFAYRGECFRCQADR